MLEFRILEVFNYSKLSRMDFANKIGVSNAVMSHISSGRNKASTDLVLTILKNFEDISPDWLLLGQGEMLRTEKGQNIKILREDLLNRFEKLNKAYLELGNAMTELQLFIKQLE